MGEILGGALFMPATKEVLRALVPVASSAPEELTTISFLMGLPPLPFIPADRVGELSLAVMFVWSGDPAEGQAAIQPFREVATPIADVAMPMPYPGIYEFTKEGERRALAVHPLAVPRRPRRRRRRCDPRRRRSIGPRPSR